MSDREVLPDTPEGWVRLAETRHYFGAVDAEFGSDYVASNLNWLLWLEYKVRSLPRSEFGMYLVWTGQHVPACVSDGKPDIPRLATLTGWSPRTIKQHLKRLIAPGADFHRLAEWPHPLAGDD